MIFTKFPQTRQSNCFFILYSLSFFLPPSVLKAQKLSISLQENNAQKISNDPKTYFKSLTYSDLTLSDSSIKSDKEEKKHTVTPNNTIVTCYTLSSTSTAQTVCSGVLGSNIAVTTNTNIGGAVRFVRFSTDQMAGLSPTLAESNFIYSYTGGYTDLAYVTPTGSSSPYTATYSFDPSDFPNTTTAPITYYVYAVFNQGVVGSTCAINPALEFKITINPKPTVSSMPDLYLCKGSASTVVSLTGSGVSGTTYSWTNNNTTVGLAASGSGNVPVFTAANATASPITATVTATATANTCVSLPQTFNIVVSPTSTTMISGFAFKDFNENGTKESAESVQAGIVVNVYDCSGTLKGTSTTDANGFWSVSGLTFGGATDKYRVEFSIPSALSSTGLQPAMTGTGSKSDVQFVSAASCNINFGVNNPDAYCQTNPFFATPCYTNGSRASNGSEAAAILYRYNDRGQGVAHDAIATVAEVGAVWGETYNPVNKKLYLSAFVKRHVDLPPNGLGAIYEIDLTTPTAAGAGTPTLWLDINASTFVDQTNTPVNLGFATDPGIVTRNLGIKTNPSRDNWAFGNVGTEGMGDIELSQDGKRLYVMDLKNRQVLCIDYVTKKLIWKLAVSTPACPGGTGDIRPWALKEHNGVLYVGSVCSGETNKNDAQLHYYVMKCNSLTAATSMSMALDLGNSITKQNGNIWWHWSNDPNEAGLGLTSLGNGAFVVHAEPLISDIEFDKDENMIVGVMDRTGHQFGINNYIPAVTNTNLITNIAVGDVTRGVLSGSTYTGETAPWSFFYLRAGIPSPPDDQFLGGLVTTSVSGTNHVVTQMIDPFDFNSNGVTWLKTSDGQQQTGIDATSRLEIVPISTSSATFGKANGLGDLAMLCAATPIQIGNYVWMDSDKDGVQDPCESPLSNITVSLWKSGTQIASTTTDVNGNYYFSNKNASGVTWTGTGADTALLVNTAYEIRIDTTNQTKLDTLKLTAANATTNSGDDQNDSDASVTGNYAVIALTTGTMGYVNHTYDFGFYPCPTIVLPSADTTICSGTSVNIRATLTNINTENIKYVYFTTHQTDPAVIYGGTSTTLGTVLNASLTSTKTVSTLSSVTFPANNTAAAITYHVYAILNPDPTAGGCRVFSERHYIVNPTPSVTAPSNQTLCTGATTTAVTFTGSLVTGTTYSWTNNTTSIGLAASGSGNIAAFTATNATSSPVTATITVTPTANGCSGTPQTFTITVNPTPSVTKPSNQTVCNTATTTAVTFAGSAVSGTTYSWTNNTTSIGLAASGTGNIAAFTATNATSSPVIATITVTPTANGCTGTAQTFTITVNPTPSVTKPSNQTVCNTTTTTAVTFAGSAVSGTTYSWTNNTTSIGLAASGTGNIAAFTATNATSSPVTATITVTPTANGCAGTTQTFTITVNPTPSVTKPSNQVLCAGATSTAITLSGSAVTGTTYNWTNDASSIGLAASGSGNIAAFTATNVTASAVTATITVTPVANTCSGAAQTFTILVNPLPTLTIVNSSCAPDLSTYSATVTSNANSFTASVGTVTGTSPNFAVSGIPTGTHSILTATNTTTGCARTQTVTDPNCSCPIVDAPTSPNDPSICEGLATPALTANVNTGETIDWYDVSIDGTPLATGTTSFTPSGTLTAGTYTYYAEARNTTTNCVSSSRTVVTLTIKPIPSISSIGDQTVCNGTTTTTVIMAGSTVTGTAYTWTNSIPSIGLAASGAGNIAAFTAVNTGSSAVSASILVIPIANGCFGSTESFTITVNPTPSVTKPSNQVICNGAATTAISFTGSAVAGTTYEWTNSTSSIGLAASGTGNIASFTAINTGSTPVVATITVTPMANGCSGIAQTFTITVNPTPSVTDPIDQTVCNGTTISAITFSGSAVAGTVYNWTNNTTSIGLAASGTGDIASFTAVNTGTSPVTATITVTPTANGCAGTPQTFGITVNPTPSVTKPANKIVCNGEATTTLMFGGSTVAGTNYEWTNNTPSIGLAANGTDDIPMFTAVNTGSTPVVATITITPMANGCSGTPQTFTITVNPTPSVTKPSNQDVCNAAATTAITFGGSAVAGTVYNWTNNNTSIGLAASGTGDIASFNAVNTSSDPILATITVTPVANGCSGAAQTFTIIVEPTPSVSKPVDQVVCNNATSTDIIFMGAAVSGVVYNWTNSNPSIGLAASGTGNITGFTATNTGTTPVVATITVTPTANGCVGTAQTMTITVNPTPTVDDLVSQTLCVGGTTTAINFTGSTVAGTTYKWTNGIPGIGLAPNGTGDIAPFTVSNGLTTAVVSTIMVTPMANGCSGTPKSMTIRVNPVSNVTKPADQIVCSGSTIADITIGGSAVASTSYSWTNSAPSIGLPANGIGDILSFTATNSTGTPVVATISITPSASGCAGTTETFTITVNPKLLSTSTVVDTATCNNGISNSDAAIAIRGITGMAKYVYGINGTTGLYAAVAVASTADSIRLSGLANPSVATTYTFRVYGSDTTCYMDVTAVLNPSSCPCSRIVMSPVPLPAGKVGEPYSTQITATGGTSPYHYIWKAGTSGTLPIGLSIDANGLVSGTPTKAGTYEVKILVDDQHACADSLDPAILTILCTYPTISTASATAATCTNAVPNSNASIAITGITNGTKYSYGTNGTAGLFASTATTLSGSTINLTGLANPSVATTYTFRIYASDTACYHDTTVVLNPAVCPTCSITSSFTQNSCNDNGTTAIKTDDYFTVTVNATSTNGGTSGKYEVVLNGTVLNTGGTTYGTSVTVGGMGVFAADGATTYSLIVRDFNIPSCTTAAHITVVTQNCSVIPCPTKACLPVTVTRIN